MKVTIALLVVYVLTLVIEVPIGLHMLIEQNGAAGSLGGAIEAIFVALMIVFIYYGGRGMRWSYVGAMVVGIVHTILSASIVVIEPWGNRSVTSIQQIRSRPSMAPSFSAISQFSSQSCRHSSRLRPPAL